MESETLNLHKVKSLQQALERTPTGEAAVEIAKALGIWTTASHATPKERRPFKVDLADATPSKLTELMAAWSGEFGRIIELCGVLNGQEAALKIEMKIAQAKARSRIRKERSDNEEKPLTVSEIKDLADEDPSVVELYQRELFLVMIAASAQAAKEATQQYLNTISREIAYRDAQMRAGVR